MGCVCQLGELLLQSASWASCCFSLPEWGAQVTVVVYVVVWLHCTRVGCTLGRWGLRAVRTTLGQWIPNLVEQAGSSQIGPTLGGAEAEP